MVMRRRPLNYRLLREQIRPADVLRVMSWRYVSRSGGQLRGPCPVHGSTSRHSRSLAVSDEIVYCHKCRWTGDAVAIWAATHGMHMLDAAYELCTLFGVEPPYLS